MREWKVKLHWEIKINWNGIWWICFSKFHITLIIRNQSESVCQSHRKRFKLMNKTLVLMLRAWIILQDWYWKEYAGFFMFREGEGRQDLLSFYQRDYLTIRCTQKNGKIHLPSCVIICLVAIDKTGLTKVLFVKNQTVLYGNLQRGNSIKWDYHCYVAFEIVIHVG